MARLGGAWRAALLAALGVGLVGGGCAEIGTDPAVPASIEFSKLPFPAIAVGDSLRDTLGVAVPLRAIVRNIGGDEIVDAPLRYLSRDTLLVVDSVTGHVFARARPSTNPVSVASRFEQSLQILSTLRVTNAPDTAFRTDTAALRSLVSEGVIGAADSNTVAVEVRVQGPDEADALQNVNGWLVRFAVVRPANRLNDTAAAVYLVDDRGRAGQVDTTGTEGLASRRVRVRSSRFPAAGAAVDTIEIEAAVMVRGAPVRGAPVRIRVPVGTRPAAAPSRR
jgi:phosphotransferase system HPr-like phosphotransfer protein